MMTETLPVRAEQIERAEQAIERSGAREIQVSSSFGGLRFGTVAEVIEIAKLMSRSDVAVPKHLRNNPGACFAVCLQAVEWRMSPYAVANKSYSVNDRLAYESQLIHAVIEQRAPLVGRLRHRYTGEGPDRRCVVWALVKGEADPFEYQSPPFAKIIPKNSPLWQTKPDLQLYYNTSRDWARMYFPDVILGVYADDELEAPAAPPARVSLKAALATSVKPHPTEPAQVIDTRDASDGIEPPAVQEQADQGDPEPPPPDLSTFDGFDQALAAVALAQGQAPYYDDAIRQLGIDHSVKATGAKGLKAREHVYAAAVNGALDWKSGKIDG